MVTLILKPAEVLDEADVEHSLPAAAVLADDDLAQKSAVLIYICVLAVDEKHSITVCLDRP